MPSQIEIWTRLVYNTSLVNSRKVIMNNMYISMFTRLIHFILSILAKIGVYGTG